jgi:hypothetical protein
VVFLALAAPVFAAPITSITDLNNFRNSQSTNDVGIQQGDVFQFGANVVPNGDAGTRVFAVQGSSRVPTTGTSVCSPLTTVANFCAQTPPFNAALNGSWTLTYINGPDQATAVTPALTAAAAAGVVPFPVNVTISGGGTTPTLTWTIPQGFTPDAMRVNVFEKNKILSNGTSDVIFSQNLSSTATSFTVPASANLKDGTQYVLNLQLIETRDHTANTGNPNSNISRRSSGFFDFTPLPSGSPPQVFLPTVGPGLGAPYNFHIDGIVQGAVIFIDPFVALGYDYAIGQGNPNFASVLFPSLQNNPYLLLFLGEPGGNPVQLLGGQQFFFPAGGVDHFSVRGINASNNLDPGNVIAFITGLTFTGNGSFTGTMTPTPLQFVAAATPESSSLFLLAGGLTVLACVAWRRRFSP